ncbi:DUF3828 domain-containing protein [Kaistia nematophila]|uniref:DUF3828 domain-containing protein n=1 Tax=Kaistia nematophila TaxID=2994654 RepID=A0A9X3DYR7_9HYPH|nr:DUF3828 domain-containing protein [Kaistia nematophila]MCX5567901.1 DUF3828 domain-containing protein [Kaistia nematophila]
MTLTRRGVARLFLVATLGAAGFSTSVGSSVAADDPEAFVASIYERYENGGDGVPLDDAATIRALFEPRLAEMILADRDEAAAVGDVPKLDGDPFVDAQDFDITDLRIDVEDGTPDRAEAHVSFLNFGEPKRIDLRLEWLETGWRIRDIYWPEGSLRGLYTH